MDQVKKGICIFDSELEIAVKKKQNGLELWEKHCTVSQRAIERGMLALKERRFLDLDPLVGDTACQMRALEIVGIYLRYLKEKDLIPSDKKFIGLSYFLTESYVIKEELRRTDHRKIAEAFEVSKKLTDQMVRSAQRMLATLSVEVIERVAQELKGNELIKQVLKPQCPRIDKFSRPLLPCYFTVLAVLKREQETGRSLQLIVEGPERTDVWIVPRNKPSAEVMVTVEGKTKCSSLEFEQALNELGFEELILICSAQHVQYGSKDVKEQTIPNEEAMQLLEEQQKKVSLFMVQHIRARTK
ncbi:MAG: hypothetical protein JSR80_02195 [Verrucomicrobia bacterium]|nr:hypothetical protein [Verrucomicrobiota bacterium]